MSIHIVKDFFIRLSPENLPKTKTCTVERCRLLTFQWALNRGVHNKYCLSILLQESTGKTKSFG